jgi:hypothetical protein
MYVMPCSKSYQSRRCFATKKGDLRMSVSCNTLLARWSRSTLLAAVFTAASVVGARAQILESLSPDLAATVTPYALFQYSTLTATGNTINASWIPIVTSTGTTIYKDFTLQFNVDASGNLTVTSGYPKVVASPTNLVASFRAGTYAGPSTLYNGEFAITVAGPGIGPGGMTQWTSAASKGAYVYTYPASATWYVGPLASNPLAVRLKAAGITSTAWSYGVGSASNWGNPWRVDTLIGVSQVGNTITFVSFTANGIDHNEPLDQITYTLQ